MDALDRAHGKCQTTDRQTQHRTVSVTISTVG